MDAPFASPDRVNDWPRRLAAAGVAVLALAWLATGTQLQPAAEIAPHQQLGLPQCSFHAASSVACPTCGMTTAFALATQGRLVAAVLVQPAGAAFALGLAMAVWVAGFVAVTGASLAPLRRLLARRWRAFAAALAILLLAGWLPRLVGG